jgi:uncharacterized protein involved in type VI secretion and phage assembly
VETDEIWEESRPITAMEFIGVVTEVSHENTIDQINSVVITAHSPTIAMDRVLRNKLFHDQSAKDIISATLSSHPITLGSVDATEGNLPYCVQYRETDFQFVMRLAGLSGLFAYYDGSKFTVGKAKTSNDDVELVFGQMLYEFKMGLGTGTEKFAAQAFDQLKKEVYDGETSGSLKTSLSGLPKLSHDASKDLYPNGSFVAGLKPSSQSALDKSLDKAREASVGRMVNCAGRSRDPRVNIGRCVKIAGMPSDFHGPHWIKSVGHRYVRGEYHNTFTCTPLDTAYPPKRYLQKKFTDIQSAIVTNTDDPDALGRVQVKFHWNSGTTAAEPEYWLRVLAPHAGSEKGFFCLPEIDDEVLVAYEEGDPDRPIIIGSLYNGVDKAPTNHSAGFDAAENDLKLFRTKSGNEIYFHDKDGSETVCITQSSGNTVTLSADGPKITVETDGDIMLKGKTITLETTSGDVTIKSGAALKAESSMDTEIKAGGNFKSEGGINHDSKGGAAINVKAPTATVQGDAMTTIKGGIVKIN